MAQKTRQSVRDCKPPQSDPDSDRNPDTDRNPDADRKMDHPPPIKKDYISPGAPAPN